MVSRRPINLKKFSVDLFWLSVVLKRFSVPKTTFFDLAVKLVVTWLRLNKLSLNSNKTELIFFHSKRLILNYDGISIKFNNKKIFPVDSIKYLAMYIDKYFSWNIHIQQLSKKLSRANGILSKLRHNAPIGICLQVYYAIFFISL